MTSMSRDDTLSPARRDATGQTAGKARVTTAVALVAAMLGGSAAAHDSPHAHWCPVGDPSPAPPAVVVVGHFDFTGPQMRILAQALLNKPGSCGQVDHPDAWLCAMQIAENYCQSLSESQSLDQVALPVFAGPQTMLNDDHHQSYQLAAGLYGACVVCAPQLETPATQQD